MVTEAVCSDRTASRPCSSLLSFLQSWQHPGTRATKGH